MISFNTIFDKLLVVYFFGTILYISHTAGTLLLYYYAFVHT